MAQSDLDQEFINTMLSIEQNYGALNKHQRIRIELWTKKLCQVTTNDVWKRNRNLYSKILLHQVIKHELSEPFDKRPPEGPLPKLNKYQNYLPQNFKENKRSNNVTVRSTSESDHNNRVLAPKPLYQNYQNQAQIEQYQQLMEQLNDQERSIQIQQQQIQQLSVFNERLVKAVIDCRQYLELMEDDKSLELKQQQDDLFQWMHEQSQQLLQYQNEDVQENNPEQAQYVNQLEQIDEQEEDNDQFHTFPDKKMYQNEDDLMAYLEKFEQKGVKKLNQRKYQEDLQRASQNILGNGKQAGAQRFQYNF